MAKYRALGNWIRKCRVSKGIRSAAELSRRTGLSTNYISILERGEYHLTWKTAEKLALALELTADERDEFFRVLDAAGKPQAVMQATVAAIVPGLALWKHLPNLLFQIPHDGFRAFDSCPDMILTDCVRASGSLLSWIALHNDPPSGKLQSRLTGQVQQALEINKKTTPPRSFENNPAWVAAIALPHLWRASVFGQAKSASSLSRKLSEWRFVPAMVPESTSVITIRFRDTVLDSHWAVWSIEPNQVADVHDAMTVLQLWNLLDLTRLLDCSPVNPYANSCTVGQDLVNLMACPIDEVRQHQGGETADSRRGTMTRLEKSMRYVTMALRARFATRVLDYPDLSRQLLKVDFPYTKEQVLLKSREIASIFGATNPK